MRDYGEIRRTKRDLNLVLTEGGQAKIELMDTTSTPIGYAIIDAQDVDKVKNFRWGLGGYPGDLYRHVKCSKLTIGLARFILDLTDKTLFVDHINGDTLNNTRSNLRIVTHKQNMFNTSKHKDNTTGYKGVVKRSENCFEVNIQKKYIGCKPTAKEAAILYNAEAIKRFGKYAKLNNVTT